MMRPLPTNEEWVLELLAGSAVGFARGTVTQKQLDGTKRMAIRWGIDPVKVETTIAAKKAPLRAGEIRPNPGI